MRPILVSGVPGSGKTTVSRSLAARFERSAHVEGDFVGDHFIVHGLVPPQGPSHEEAEAQLRLRRRNICLLTDSFLEAGFVTIVDDVIVSPSVLALYSQFLKAPVVALVQLNPSLEVIAARDHERDKQVFAIWSHLHAELQRMPRIGLWVDSSSLSVEQTVDMIFDRLHVAEVDLRTL